MGGVTGYDKNRGGGKLPIGSGAAQALDRLSLSPRMGPWPVDSVGKVMGTALSIALAVPRSQVVRWS